MSSCEKLEILRQRSEKRKATLAAKKAERATSKASEPAKKPAKETIADSYLLNAPYTEWLAVLTSAGKEYFENLSTGVKIDVHPSQSEEHGVDAPGDYKPAAFYDDSFDYPS